MSPSKVYESHDIVANVNYWKERSDGSLPTVEDAPKIFRQGKEADTREMAIHDIRSHLEDFTLNQNGFQVWNLLETPNYTKDDKEIEDNQYPEIIQTIKDVTGGSSVHMLGHIIRDKLDLASEEEKLSLKSYGKDGPRAPAMRPHTDFALETCAANMSSYKPELAAYIATGKRWQIIGVWRPLKAVQRDPLALLDARTVRDSDFVTLARDYDGKKGANSVLKPGGEGLQHSWYWLHEQQPNEAFLFKHFDSLQEEGNAQRCAHTAFELPGTNDLPLRESIEFRALVFY